jgi:hypothetical protein
MSGVRGTEIMAVAGATEIRDGGGPPTPLSDRPEEYLFGRQFVKERGISLLYTLCLAAFAE